MTSPPRKSNDKRCEGQCRKQTLKYNSELYNYIFSLVFFLWGTGWGYVGEGVRLRLKCGWDDWLCFSEAALRKYHERGCELALEAQLPLLNNQLCKLAPAVLLCAFCLTVQLCVRTIGFPENVWATVLNLLTSCTGDLWAHSGRETTYRRPQFSQEGT